jgi:hypothetical protein
MRDRHRVGQPTWVTIRDCHDVGRPSRVHRAYLNCGKNVDRKEDEPKKRKPWDSSPALELSQGVFFRFGFTETPLIRDKASCCPFPQNEQIMSELITTPHFGTGQLSN